MGPPRTMADPYTTTTIRLRVRNPLDEPVFVTVDGEALEVPAGEQGERAWTIADGEHEVTAGTTAAPGEVRRLRATFHANWHGEVLLTRLQDGWCVDGNRTPPFNLSMGGGSTAGWPPGG
jgi:hypothetical protein